MYFILPHTEQKKSRVDCGLPGLAGLRSYEHKSFCNIVTCMISKNPLTLRDLYPTLTEEQLAEVEDSLERYLALVLRICERIISEDAQLTANA